MSYPRKISSLIVEDEDEPCASYRSHFDAHAKAYDLAAPVFARSFQEARERLEEPNIFQLVILDLVPFPVRKFRVS